MAIRVVRLGQPRHAREGTRIGTVRRPPRGVKKVDFARLDYYDVWLPELAPGAQLLSWATAEEMSDPRWKRFTREYRREMKGHQEQHLISLLTVMSRDTNFSVGCYCENALRCHRTLLAELLEEAGAVMEGD